MRDKGQLVLISGYASSICKNIVGASANDGLSYICKWKTVACFEVSSLSKAKLLLLGLIFVLGMFAVMKPATAARVPFDEITCSPAFPGDCTISNSGKIEVVVGASGFNTVTLTSSNIIETGDLVIFSGGLFSGPPPMGCVSGLPAGAACNFVPTSVTVPASTASESSTLTISTSPSTPPGTYPITVDVGLLPPAGAPANLGPASIQPMQTFHVFETHFNLIVDPAVVPEYPLGLPILAIFLIFAYGLIRRKTITKQK